MTQAKTVAKPNIVNLDELEQQAKQQLDQASYDFVAGGAGSEQTLRANREAFQKITIIPRVLTGIKDADTSMNLLGQRLSMPIYVTPMANHGVVHPLAEVGSAQGGRVRFDRDLWQLQYADPAMIQVPSQQSSAIIQRAESSKATR